MFSLFYFFTFVCLLYGLFNGNYRVMFIAVLTILLFLVCSFVEKFLAVKFPFCLKLLIFIFIFCAQILGEMWSFYVLVPFWDKALHFLSGFITGCCGFSLIYFFIKGFVRTRDVFFLSFLFILCFSVSIGVVWEFVEFGFDRFFGLDMQKDTVVSEINTVSVGSLGNVVNNVDGIVRTEIFTEDGKVVVDSGYLDIGLVDTIDDLFMGSIGAVIVACFGGVYIASGKRFCFIEKFRVK